MYEIIKRLDELQRIFWDSKFDLESSQQVLELQRMTTALLESLCCHWLKTEHKIYVIRHLHFIPVSNDFTRLYVVL